MTKEFGESGKILPPAPGAPVANVFMVEAVNGKQYYAYEFPHPSVAATVVLFDISKNSFLLIERDINPFKGCFAFPGGFLDVGKEEIEDAAVRELYEETGIRLDRSKLQLIDVRSHPKRDPRDHIFDIAYFATVDHADAIAGDEVSAYKWAQKDEIDALALAFDHDVLWGRVKSRFL
ncbi:MAG: NUDIX hydrolase [Bacteroidota bacterium]